MERAEHLASCDAKGIERSCKTEFLDGLRIAPPGLGLERIEARFRGKGFSPHRHDTYALGLTFHGVQTFRYRGVERFSYPGNVIVLHPDEVHDGAAGTDDGLIYRMVYVPPELISAVNEHRSSLPFVADPILVDAQFQTALIDVLANLDHQPDELEMDDAIVRIAACLSRQSGAPGKGITPVAQTAVLRARDFLESHCDDAVSSGSLEKITGLDRYELARQFRRVLGTSPHRYLVMRRLDRAKHALAAGVKLADAAVDAGFADQAHFTRHFRSAFGLTPGRWMMMQNGGLSYGRKV